MSPTSGPASTRVPIIAASCSSSYTHLAQSHLSCLASLSLFPVAPTVDSMATTACCLLTQRAPLSRILCASLSAEASKEGLRLAREAVARPTAAHMRTRARVSRET